MAGAAFESINLGGRRFSCADDDEPNVAPNGTTNELQMNGDGSMRIIKTHVAGVITDINVSLSNERNDLEYLQELQDRGDFFDVSATEYDGTVYAGSMQFTGDRITKNAKNMTAAIELGGRLEKQGA